MTADGGAGVRGVGPATAEALAAADVAPEAVAERRISYRELLAAGVNPGVAARLRRDHSLVWAFEYRPAAPDLVRRAEQVRGLTPGERAWVAASVRPPTETDTDGWAASLRAFRESRGADGTGE
jgi:hypothetical protein